MEGLLKRLSGCKLYSASHLPKKVLAESQAVSSYLATQTQSTQMSFHFAQEVDIYHPTAPEIVYFDDAVGVKRQHEVRRVPWADGYKETATVQTDVVVIEDKAKESVTYLSSAESNMLGIDLEDWIKIKLSKLYGNVYLPLVAIIDGARTIRLRLIALFGTQITIILDWYHLQKKVTEYLSRLGLAKDIKQKHIDEVCHYLWRGQVREALHYTDVVITTTRPQILEELQNYLLKHESEICNYDKRQKAGKVIGSGKGEKANDTLVANRQKKKAMSWGEHGSNALTILQTLQNNQNWENYWAYAA